MADNAPLMSGGNDRNDHYEGTHNNKNSGDKKKGDRGSTWGGVGAKSLVLCLVLDNPFDPNSDHEPIVDESMFPGLSAEVLAGMRRGKGAPTTLPREEGASSSPLAGALSKSASSAVYSPDGNSSGNTSGAFSPPAAGSNPIDPTFLCDDDFLLVQGKTAPAPNKYQKVIETVLRLQKKGLDISPEGMIVECDVSLKNTTPNYFHGYQLQEHRLLTSPDKDEMYIKIHASTSVLLKFAEVMSLPLLSHNYSFGGGAAIPYSKEVHRRLDDSVNLYHKAYGLTEEQDYTPGKSNGYYFDPQHKMRVLIRLLREQWRFGGCGIQINELRKKKILVRNLFPLHNHTYLQVKGLHDWASLRALASVNPLRMNKENIMCYFGEEVGLYFIWIKEFCLVLIPLGIAGLVCGVGGSIDHRAVFNGVFAFCCVIWACYWNVHWGRIETEFALENCQEEQLDQEPLRDEFECKDVVPVEYKDIYDLTFNVPLSLQVQSDGSMVDLYYPNIRRQLVRFLIGYPVVLVLTAAMIAALIAITWWRFEHTDSEVISYVSSILTVLTSVIFGVLFEKIVELLNSLENNRTDTEEDHERIKKSFLFYFFSNYFALFILALYPLEGPQYERLKQLQSQMIIICVVKPMVQNLQELMMPYFKSQLRTRTDAKGSMVGGILSFIKCESYAKVLKEGSYDPEEPGTALWLEAQMEPCTGTSSDYLEITLQFGYMAMFGATFPFAAPAAVLYNFLELRIDAMKFTYHIQRPIAAPAASIGPWSRIFVMLTMCAVVTNSYLVIMLSPILEKFNIPEPDSKERQYQVLLIVHYLFIVFMILLTASVGTTSVSLMRLRSKRKMLSNKSTREKAANHFKRILEDAIHVGGGGNNNTISESPLTPIKTAAATPPPQPPVVPTKEAESTTADTPAPPAAVEDGHEPVVAAPAAQEEDSGYFDQNAVIPVPEDAAEDGEQTNEPYTSSSV